MSGFCLPCLLIKVPLLLRLRLYSHLVWVKVLLSHVVKHSHCQNVGLCNGKIFCLAPAQFNQCLHNNVYVIVVLYPTHFSNTRKSCKAIDIKRTNKAQLISIPFYLKSFIIVMCSISFYHHRHHALYMYLYYLGERESLKYRKVIATGMYRTQ